MERRAPSRRTVLRGAGLGLALPLLPSLGRGREEAAGPLRLAVVYLPNGIHLPHWRPAEEGPLGADLPPLLAALERHRERVSVLSGLTLDKARANGDGPGDHARACAAFLTASQPVKADGSVVRVGTSVDQVVARGLAGETRLSSLQLGCEGARSAGQCDSGYPCTYSSHLSWRDPVTPLPHETDPRRTFDRLFGTGLEHLAPEERAERLRLRRSVLDLVRDDARSLAAGLSASDRSKLEQYLDGVRALERRLDRADDPASAPTVRPDGRPETFREHVALQYELLALGLASDATRVATFLVANEGSNRAYRELGLTEGHHALSHHGGDPEKQAGVARINAFHLELFAGFLDRLAELGVLDDTLVLLGSGIADGNRHDHSDLPVLLAGGGGRVPLGVHRRYPAETPLADLHLALVERFGFPATALGDGTGPLAL